MKTEDKFSKLLSNTKTLLDYIRTAEEYKAFKTNEYLTFLRENQIQINNAKKQFERHLLKSIPIKLSDLIQEICAITKTDITKLNVKLTTNMFLSKISYDSIEDLDQEKLSRKINTNLEVSIKDDINKSTGIKIYMYFPFNFSDKLANGETLFNACGLHSLENDFEIVIDKNIGDYVCNFTLDGIINETQVPTCQPSGILQEAVKNCYNKNKLFKPETEENLEQEK